MAQQRLVVGFASNRQQAEAAAEQLRSLGLVPRVTERTGEADLPYAVAYYARSGRDAARLEAIFEALEIDGDVVYEELPGDHRLVQIYSAAERPGALTMLANLLERAGVRVVKAFGELLVPRGQEPLALDVIRQFEQTWPKKRPLLEWFDEKSSEDADSPSDESDDALAPAESMPRYSTSAFVHPWDPLALAAWDAGERDLPPSVGPAMGQLPKAWPCCPSCRRPRDTQCPMCGETGCHFPPAEQVPEEFVNNRPVPAELADTPWPLLCPICDWLFEPEFYRRCAWCGHDFGQGREIPVKSPTASEPINLRLVLGVVITAVVVIAVLAYFAIATKVRDPKVRPMRAVPAHGGIIVPQPQVTCLLL